MARVEAEFVVDIKKFERSLKRAEGKINRWARRVTFRMDRLGRTFERAGTRMSALLTAPLAAAGFAAGKSAAKFDAELTKINALVGVSRDQLNKWRADLLKIGPAVGRGPVELAEALFFITSAQIRGNAAIQTLIASAKASAVGLGETKTVADAATSAMKAFATQNLGASDAVGILVATIREGKLQTDQLSQSLSKVIPIAGELGLTFNEVGAAVATMSLTGTDAATAGTQLRGVLSKILKPAAEAEEALKKIGLSMADLRKMLKEDGLLATLELLKTKFEGNEGAMARVFEDVRALTGVLQLVGKNASEAQKIFSALASAGAADLDKAFRALSDDSMFRFRQAQAAVNASMIQLGSAILPEIVPLVGRLTAQIVKLTQAFSRLSPETKSSILKIAGIVALVGPVSLAVGAIITVFSGFIRAVVFAGVIVTKTVRVIAVALARLAAIVAAEIAATVAAFGAIPVAIGASLAAAVGVFIVFKESIITLAKAIWTNLRLWLVEKFVNNIVRPFIKTVNEINKKLAALTGQKFDPIKVPIEIKTDALRTEIFGKALEKAGVEARQSIARLKSEFSSMSEAAKAAIKKVLPEGIGEFLFGPDGADALQTQMEDFFEGLKSKLAGVEEAAQKTGNKMRDRLQEAGKTIQESVTNRVEDAIVRFESLGKTISNVARIIRDELVRSFIAAPIAGVFGKAIGSLLGVPDPGEAASGGRISGPTIVGERGRELFIPSVPGTVKNTNDTRSILSSGPRVTVNQTLVFETTVKDDMFAAIQAARPVLVEDAKRATVAALRGIR